MVKKKQDFDCRTLLELELGLFKSNAIFGRAYFRAMLIFESCLFKSPEIFGRAYFRNLFQKLCAYFRAKCPYLALSNRLKVRTTYCITQKSDEYYFRNPHIDFQKIPPIIPYLSPIYQPCLFLQ